MELHVGLKLINSMPMTRQEYNTFRGWQLPENENGDDKGYLVEYLDGGQANTSQCAGYVSWSPEDVFNKAYKSSGNFSFSAALELVKKGNKVARAGWNGKGMWIALERVHLSPQERHFEWLTVLPYIAMKTADSSYVPWLCSQTDMLADDWCIV